MLPAAGAATGRTARRPFPDEVARALAAEANLAELAAACDPGDNGARDIWETTVTTGRRIGEAELIKAEYSAGKRIYETVAEYGHSPQTVRKYALGRSAPGQVTPGKTASPRSLAEVAIILLSSMDVYRAYELLLAGEGGRPVPITEDAGVRPGRYPLRGHV